MSLISFLAHLLFVDSIATDFSKFILYLATLLRVFISCEEFPGGIFLGHPCLLTYRLQIKIL